MDTPLGPYKLHMADSWLIHTVFAGRSHVLDTQRPIKTPNSTCGLSYHILTGKLCFFSSIRGLPWIICLHLTLSVASSSVTPTSWISPFNICIHKPPLWSSFRPAGPLHLDHPLSNISTTRPLQIFLPSETCLSTFVSSTFLITLLKFHG